MGIILAIASPILALMSPLAVVGSVFGAVLSPLTEVIDLWATYLF